MKSKKTLKSLSKLIFQKYEPIMNKHLLDIDIKDHLDIYKLMTEFNIPYTSLFKLVQVYKTKSEYSFYNITTNPYEFVLLPEQILDYEKATYIAEKLDLSISMDIKHRAWIYDFILFKNNSIYIKHSYLSFKFYDMFKTKLNGELCKSKVIGSDVYTTLIEIYQMEEEITNLIRKLNPTKVLPFDINTLKKKISDYEMKHEFSFTKYQKTAICDSVKKNLHLICGYPGTGKTTIVDCICTFYSDEVICLTAPTGMAVNNLIKKTNIAYPISGTLHKLIYGKFDDVQEVPKIIIIDEFSMVDNCVFLNILRYCVAFKCKLIILADQHQLPPIGGGFPLDNLLQSNEISETFLTKIKRQDNGNLKDAILNISNNVLLKNSEFDKKSLHFYNYSKSNLENLIKKFNLHPNNCQFISPQHKYDQGTMNMNNILQNIFSPKKHPILINSKYKPSNSTFYNNDEIVRIVNNYTTKELYANGDLAVVKILDDKTVNIHYKNNSLIQENVSIEDLYDEFQLSYCLTVHKVQGSQYENVVLLLSNDHKFSWENSDAKKLLYTAVSRAQKRCFILGDPNLIYSAQTSTPKPNISNILK
jgi:exodeoxyribonuclease V alpha subunit